MAGRIAHAVRRPLSVGRPRTDRSAEWRITFFVFAYILATNHFRNASHVGNPRRRAATNGAWITRVSFDRCALSPNRLRFYRTTFNKSLLTTLRSEILFWFARKPDNPTFNPHRLIAAFEIRVIENSFLLLRLQPTRFGVPTKSDRLSERSRIVYGIITLFRYRRRMIDVTRSR